MIGNSTFSLSSLVSLNFASPILILRIVENLGFILEGNKPSFTQIVVNSRYLMFSIWRTYLKNRSAKYVVSPTIYSRYMAYLIHFIGHYAYKKEFKIYSLVSKWSRLYYFKNMKHKMQFIRRKSCIRKV